MAKNEEFVFDLIREIAVLSSSAKGWDKVLSYVRWGANEPTYDLRNWNMRRTSPSRGISLTIEELKDLKAVLNQMPELND